MTTGLDLDQFEIETAKSMDKVGLTHFQIDLHNPEQVKRAKSHGFEFATNAFDISKASATLDLQSGFAYADRACYFVLHKARELGVQFVLGAPQGRFQNFLEDAAGKISGVRTADGKSHLAELTILACGGWTPGLLPQLDNLCETTAGSVVMFQLPPDDQALWDKFAPENFPTWS
jgi:sarcosine oxidase / L-pipecolate oxidase